ncbi:myeloid-associated differentiation marker homolog [Notolabrus celidotus]|uniref:myeloid-associated differentiation marker homolog n=1 Tax=Notolabrus celidotus TaxID=1203425 RepID=UPI001490470B|nr:myeloid-associated differentiation marker homolog [Notolabrus celidotus]
MPVIVLEARDFASPLFLVRTLEILSGCTTFSLVASLEDPELNKNSTNLHFDTFRIFCMFTWCFFFILSLLIHILSVIQFHSLIPVSWKNLTMTVAVLGELMCFTATVLYSWIIMDHQMVSPRPVVAAVASCLTCLAYISESYVLRTQAHEQRGYMGSMPGILKTIQLWGGCLMIPLIVEVVRGLPSGVHIWQVWVTGVSYGVCVLVSLVTLVVILGDFAGRCLLPFDRLLAGFSLIGVLLYMVATVICFTKILQLRDLRQQMPNESAGLVIMETVIASITLLAYSVDLAFSIKLLCDRSYA